MKNWYPMEKVEVLKWMENRKQDGCLLETALTFMLMIWVR